MPSYINEIHNCETAISSQLVIPGKMFDVRDATMVTEQYYSSNTGSNNDTSTGLKI
jgi:hypothetical protein